MSSSPALLPLLFAFSLVSARPLPAARPAQACTGCLGNGGLGVQSGGVCGGRVEISVQVEPGKCKWAMTDEEFSFECRGVKPCHTLVTRKWSGLPPGSQLDFCIELDGDTYCLGAPIEVDPSGAGESVRPGPDRTCGSQPYAFTIRSSACALGAVATATCSSCAGSL